MGTNRSAGNRRSGFALPAAVGALVIIGVLVTAGFYMAHQEVRIGTASANAARAFYLAEYGTVQVLENWNAGRMATLALWADTTIADTLSYGRYSVGVRKLTDRLFMLDATGTITEGGPMLSGATRRTGLLVRLFTGDVSPPAALTTRGPTSLRGSAEIRGIDIYPPGWESICTNPLTNKPGVVHGDTLDIEWSGVANVVRCTSTGSGKNKVTTCDTIVGGGNITGSPHLVQDNAMTDTSFNKFGDMTWAQLVAMADKNITSLGTNINNTGPVVSGGQCVTSDLLNWGDPENPNGPCGNYFPIIYHGGSLLRIQSGGRGQGILLVEGNLDLRGNFVFNGVIITQGNFETQGSGNRIVGGVMASNANLLQQNLVGGSVVQYSRCAVERALLNNSSLTRARPLAQRSFVDLSNLMGG